MEPKSPIVALNNPGYIDEYEHAKSFIWQLNHLGIKLDLLDKMTILGSIRNKMREKDAIAKKKWGEGQRDPDPYDEAAVHCVAINEYLLKCYHLMEECLAAESAWETEQYLSRQALGNPPDLSKDPMRRQQLSNALGRFKAAKRKFLDSLNSKKSPELAELMFQLK